MKKKLLKKSTVVSVPMYEGLFSDIMSCCDVHTYH